MRCHPLGRQRLLGHHGTHDLRELLGLHAPAQQLGCGWVVKENFCTFHRSIHCLINVSHHFPQNMHWWSPYFPIFSNMFHHVSIFYHIFPSIPWFYGRITIYFYMSHISVNHHILQAIPLANCRHGEGSLGPGGPGPQRRFSGKPGGPGWKPWGFELGFKPWKGSYI